MSTLASMLPALQAMGTSLVTPVAPVRVLRAVRAEPRSGNLPGEISAFVGRARELARLREMQPGARLLTLVGPSGVGKTRLALRLATELQADFDDGAWLVDLSPLVDPSLVAPAVGDVLGVCCPSGEAYPAELIDRLHSRQVLLLLDNCERLSGACGVLVDTLLRACPRLSVLATSLHPLGATGETTWRVAPLRVASPTASTCHELVSSEAVQLFLARLQTHMPEFEVGEANVRAIAEICRELDGLPLALELVAARVESLGIAEISARSGQLFDLAQDSMNLAPVRQRTLRAAVEWSCSQLTDRERVLLRRLSIFARGWTLSAAEAVCVDDRVLPDAAVLDTLSRLVARSLVVTDHDGLHVRYRLLETVRVFAQEQLSAAGEQAMLEHRYQQFMLQSGEPVRIIRALEGLARRIAVRDADPAVRLLGACDAQRQALGSVAFPGERHANDEWLRASRRQLGDDAFQRAWEDGRTSTLAQAIAMAEALTARPQALGALTPALTAREQEVAALLARGMTNKQVAAHLLVSHATVRTHVEHILTKLDLRSRAQIAVWATQHGLVSVPDNDCAE